MERKLSLSSKPSEPTVQMNRQDRQGSRDNKESLVAAFFDNKPNAQTQLKKPEKVFLLNTLFLFCDCYLSVEELREKGQYIKIKGYPCKLSKALNCIII